MYVPRFFGIETYGEPDKINISEGDEISLKFKSLTKYQQQELTKNFPEVEFDFDRSNVIFSEN